MTAARRVRKRYVWPLALGACLGGLRIRRLHAATTERVVVDRHTGLAIYGIDPVAYFTERKPIAGARNSSSPCRRGLALRQRRQPAAFCADPTSTCRGSAATIRSASRAAWRRPESGALGRHDSASISSIRPSARGLPRQSAA
jgi:hypothetical protein